MNGINKAIIVGRVGQDPRVTTFDNGSKVAQFSLATTERGYRTRDGREVPEKTEWHNIVCHGSLADVVSKYVSKGSSLYVEGKLRSRKYTDKSNIERIVTEIYVDDLQLLDGKKQEDASVAAPESAQQRQTQQTDNLSTGENSTQQSENKDDLPF